MLNRKKANTHWWFFLMGKNCPHMGPFFSPGPLSPQRGRSFFRRFHSGRGAFFVQGGLAAWASLDPPPPILKQKPGLATKEGFAWWVHGSCWSVVSIRPQSHGCGAVPEAGMTPSSHGTPAQATRCGQVPLGSPMPFSPSGLGLGGGVPQRPRF